MDLCISYVLEHSRERCDASQQPYNIVPPRVSLYPVQSRLSAPNLARLEMHSVLQEAHPLAAEVPGHADVEDPFIDFDWAPKLIVMSTCVDGGKR